MHVQWVVHAFPACIAPRLAAQQNAALSVDFPAYLSSTLTNPKIPGGLGTLRTPLISTAGPGLLTYLGVSGVLTTLSL